MNISSDQYHNGLGLFRQALNDPSLELEWIWKPVHQKSAIHRDEFQSIYQRLLLPKLGLIRQDCPETLDIRFDGTDLRCSIVGMPLIQHYCKQNTIDRLLKTSPQSVSFLRKRSKGSPLVLSNYYLRCNLKEEIDVEHDDAEVQTLLSNWSSTPKTFRLKKRYSFTDQNKLLRYDLTIVKHSPLTHNGSMKYSTNFEIEKKMPSYEVELEWTGDTRAFNLQEKIITETEKFTSSQMTTLSKAAFNYTIRYLGYVIQVSQDSCSIISKADKNDILREYQSLVSDKSQQHHHKHHHQSTVTSRDWIGPQPASLNMDHIRYYKDGWDGAISIRSGYAVTPKADGDRAMLYISASGNLYLMYRRMEVKTTGLRLESLHGTLLDGELVTTNREGQKIRLFLVFDLYFLDKNDVRGFPFQRTLADIEQYESSNGRVGIPYSRYELLEQSVIPLLAEISRPEYLTIELKPFRFGNCDLEEPSIFQESKSLLEEIDGGVFQYPCDGLVYLPYQYPVGGDYPVQTLVERSNKAGQPSLFKKKTVRDGKETLEKWEAVSTVKKSGTTWIRNLKWKPSTDNTIDFLVEIVTAPDENQRLVDKIGYHRVKSSFQKYKTLILKTGYNTFQHESINICRILQEGDEALKHAESSYRPREFRPTHPSDDRAYLANIPLTTDGDGVERLLCEKSREEIETNVIVEMSYDPSREEGWRWVARNVRWDKTYQLRNGEGQYGNDYQVAHDIWKGYHNPITEKMISGETDIPDEVEEETRYYARAISRDQSLTRAMLDFHNLYVKFNLINSVASHLSLSTSDTKLLDLACGKAGDLSKWIQDYHIKTVVGVDVSQDNIENPRDGACVRYHEKKMKTLKYRGDKAAFPHMYFLVGDSSLDLASGAASKSALTPESREEYRKLFQILWGKTVQRSQLNELQQNMMGVAEGGFHMVSLQFALHYFFKNIESLRGLIHNVVSNTRLNGYFIGTCFDGGTIFNRLEAKSKGEMISGTVGQSTLWKIKKNYEKETTPLGNLVARSRSFPASHKSLGKSIIVYMETINQYLEEYLVNFDYLTKLMNMNGFQVVGREEANKMGLPNGTGLFQEMFQQIPPPKKDESSFGNSREMSEVDKEFSFMNRWFVFKKVEEVSTIKLDVAVKKMPRKNAPKKADPPPPPAPAPAPPAPPAKTQDPEPVKTPDADKSKPEVKKKKIRVKKKIAK